MWINAEHSCTTERRARQEPVCRKWILKSSHSTPWLFSPMLASGAEIVERKPKEAFFCQGDKADSVFYLQKGRAKLTVVSHERQRGYHHVLSAGEFVGEESLAAIVGLRLATATAVNMCTALEDWQG